MHSSMFDGVGRFIAFALIAIPVLVVALVVVFVLWLIGVQPAWWMLYTAVGVVVGAFAVLGLITAFRSLK